ncbi:MAG: hypothetical protein HYT43_02415 [Candidatus Taylorbacteria bacterium]|nr:hypothetical protein [Candidatus Taylorbacteria bacterium]
MLSAVRNVAKSGNPGREKPRGEVVRRREPYKILLVPFPIDPIFAFEYFLYRLCGLVKYGTKISYFWVPLRSESEINHHRVRWRYCREVHLLVGEIELELIRTLKKLPDGTPVTRRHREILWKLFKFCRDYMRSERGLKRSDIQRLLDELFSPKVSPALILESVTDCFMRCLREGSNPMRRELYVTELMTTTDRINKPEGPVPELSVAITIPGFGVTTGAVVKGGRKTAFELDGRGAWELQREKIVVVVGGPAGEGKSTIAAGIFEELVRIIKRLKKRGGWEGFGLEVEGINLDLATPTLNAIASGFGREDKLLDSEKRPWTMYMACEALERLALAKERANIVIADLPGGPPDYITQITAALGDIAVVVYSQNEESDKWAAFFSRLGVVPMVYINSSGGAEIQSGGSCVMWYTPRVRLTANMAGLNRRLKRDSRIRTIANVLLFNLLPAFVSRKAKELEKFKKVYQAA